MTLTIRVAIAALSIASIAPAIRWGRRRRRAGARAEHHHCGGGAGTDRAYRLRHPVEPRHLVVRAP